MLVQRLTYFVGRDEQAVNTEREEMADKERTNDRGKEREAGERRPARGGDPGAESEKSHAEGEEIIEKAQLQGRVVEERYTAKWPPADPSIERAMQRHRAGD